MKNKWTISLLLLFLPLGLGTNSCTGDNENDYYISDNNYVGKVENLSGVMHYANDVQAWYISVFVQTTYDRVIQYFPITIGNEFKEENKSVIFSGSTCDFSGPDSSLGGVERYGINLQTIKWK